MGVGIDVGSAVVGNDDGTSVGNKVGAGVGCMVGRGDGICVGTGVGTAVGISVGKDVGAAVNADTIRQFDVSLPSARGAASRFVQEHVTSSGEYPG